MSAIAAFTLTSTATQSAVPFVVGHTFAAGEVPAGQYAHLDVANFAVVPLNVWNDGSLKFAMLCGRASLTAATPFQVNIVKRSSAPAAGTLLTAASIAAAAPTASIQFGSNGTATLAGLSSPHRTWYSTKEVVCCEYVAQAGSDPHLWAQFFVWLFADGRRFTRAVANNGFFMGGATRRDYVPTATIDGVMVYNKGGAVYYHSPAATWDVTHWTGTDPAITPRHDTGRLIAFGMPNYEKTSTASAITTYLASISGYTPGARLGFSESMGGVGFQEDIGLLPQWEGNYFVTRGSKAAYDAVIANGRAIRSYAIAFADPTTYDAIKLSDYPTHTLDGAGGGGWTTISSKAQDGTTNYNWEIAHHPTSGVLPYLLSADPYFLQTAQYTAKLCFLMQTSGSGSGVNRVITGQPRGRAWSWRSIMLAGAICPDAMTAQYGDSKTWFANLMADGVTRYASLSGPGAFLGMVDQYDNYLSSGRADVIPDDVATPGDNSNCAGVSFWQHDFITSVLGLSLDLEPCTSTGMTSTQTFFNYAAKSIVWRLGPGGDSTAYYFGYASMYFYAIPKSTTLGDGTAITAVQAIPSNAGEVFLHTTNGAATTDNTLHGYLSGVPGVPYGYWPQALTAVSYAIDHGVTGAQVGFNRVLGASNYSVIDSADTALQPNFGITPRNRVTQSDTFTAVDTGIVTTPGPSFVWDSVPLMAGFFVWGTHRGLGMRAQDIPSTGTDGAPPWYNDLDLPADNDSEIWISIDAMPTLGGDLVFDGLGGFSYDGPADSFTWTGYQDGGDMGSAAVPLLDGTSSVTGVTVSPSTATGSTTFTGTVEGPGSPSQVINWSATGGSITSGGVFTEPAQTTSIQIITVIGTSAQDGTKYGTATVTIAAADAVTSAPRYARPSSDVSAGGWLPSTGSSLSAMLDETVADASDYIRATSASACTVALNAVTDPHTSSNQTVRYQVWSASSNALTVQLKQGATVIASWAHASLPTTPTVYEQALTSAQCDAITDYADLRFTFTAA